MSVNWFRADCRRTRKLARLAAAGCLSEAERAGLAQHAGRCSDCRYYAAELNVLNGLLQDWDRSWPEPVVTPELSAQWRRAIQSEARPARESVRAPDPVERRAGWMGIDRAVPVSLVLIWLVTIGIHLNTPAVTPAGSESVVPTLREVRMVMEWLMTQKEAA